MDVFVCVGCGAVLTVPVAQVVLPPHTHQRYGYGELLPVLMESGTYAVDPEPSGPPWRSWDQVGVDEAAARGVFAPLYALSYGAPGAVVLAPGDIRGTVLIPERCAGYCCGLDGGEGPNLACERCGRAVAARVDDCSVWQAVRLAPDAVLRRPVDGPTRPALDWETFAREWPGRPPLDQSGRWDLRWEAAAGVALAHLVVASAGAPVTVPDGLVAATFRRALDRLLPPGPPAKHAALAGPGLPAPDPVLDIALVPIHPYTGETWQPPGGTVSAVPVSADVWVHLAFPHERLPLPATGGFPAGVLRDDPLPLHPWGWFRPDPDEFRRTLARLPVVREPWLRRIYDQG
ncbi:hypothetical protein [Embleya sp. AB8]|uniref:hypothetical protein n=1 Tax=Embleya sp. AB8 TaxID=3156304 RepID=UPI003C77D6DD